MHDAPNLKFDQLADYRANKTWRSWFPPYSSGLRGLGFFPLLGAKILEHLTRNLRRLRWSHNIGEIPSSPRAGP